MLSEEERHALEIDDFEVETSEEVPCETQEKSVELPDVCGFCHLQKSRLYICICKGVRYCSEDCVKKDKEYHLTICEYIQTFKPKIGRKNLSISPEILSFEMDFWLDDNDPHKISESFEGFFEEFIKNQTDELIVRHDYLYDKLKNWIAERIAGFRGDVKSRALCWKEKVNIARWENKKPTVDDEKNRKNMIKKRKLIPLETKLQRLPDICFWCLEEKIAVRQCSCGYAFYCNEECQKNHYKIHKKACKRIRDCNVGVLKGDDLPTLENLKTFLKLVEKRWRKIYKKASKRLRSLNNIASKGDNIPILEELKTVRNLIEKCQTTSEEFIDQFIRCFPTFAPYKGQAKEMAALIDLLDIYIIDLASKMRNFPEGRKYVVSKLASLLGES